MAEAFALKQARLASLPSPKVVLLGGSNTLFSLDSGLIEGTWGRPVVNLAVNAALELDYILASAAPYLRAGDLVLLPLEYPLYLWDGRPNQQLLDHVIRQDPAYWWRLPVAERLAWVAGVPLHLLLAGFAPQPEPLPPGEAGPYPARLMDERGDYQGNDPDRLTPAQRQELLDQAVRRAQARRYSALDGPAARGWERLGDFHRIMTARGVCLLAVPPALMAQAAYRDDPQEQAFFRQVPARVRRLGLPFVGDPFAFMYPRSSFFDTIYHLTAAARTTHSQALLAALGPDPWRHCAQDPGG